MIKKIFILSVLFFTGIIFVRAESCTYEYLYSISQGDQKIYHPVKENLTLKLEYNDKTAKITELNLNLKNWKKDESGFSNVGISSCPIFIFPTSYDDREWYGINSFDKTVQEKILKKSKSDYIPAIYGLKDSAASNQKYPSCIYNHIGFAVFNDIGSVSAYAFIGLQTPSVQSIKIYEEYEKYILNSENFECSQIYVCSDKGLDVSGNGVVETLTVYRDFSQYNLSGDEHQVCETLYLSNDADHSKIDCTFFTNEKISNYIKEYKACNDLECQNTLKSKYTDLRLEIKEMCKSALNTVDYDDPCLKPCLDYESYFFDKDYSDLDGEKCGLSTKLLVWIINIVKWVKYIVPVIVILFGMVDFIRAILSEKDDEMKKAQGRFVRRLIAAALIFVVPLVLTFILEKMGFSSNMCGINF